MTFIRYRQVTEKAVIANFGPGEFAVSNNSGDNHMGKYEYSKEDGLWKHTDGVSQIEQGSTIRAKVVKLEWFEHLKDFETYCSLKGDFLGVVQVPFAQKRGEILHARTSIEDGA